MGTHRKKKKYKVKSRFVFFVILCIVIFVGAFILVPKMLNSDNKTDTEEKKAVSVFANKTDLTIMCSGDNMVHQPQLEAGKTGDGYSFNACYDYVKKPIEKADLALCNMEVTFPGSRYTGYPAFRTPDALADAVKYAGFDVAITSNNHMVDSGADGLKRTKKVLEKVGLPVVGSRQNHEEKNYLVKDVKGVKVGIISYTYADSVSEDKVLINGNPLSGDDMELANFFTKSTVDQDLKKIEKSVSGAEKDGAEIVVVYYHWGTEYQTIPSELQEKVAKATAKMNVDMIFASHPHVLQRADIIKVKDDQGKVDKKVPIYYSLGNFISNQNRVTLNDVNTEIGALGVVKCTYNPKTDRLENINMDPIPTWVNKYYSGKTKYRIVPLEGNYTENESVVAANGASKAKEARKIAYDILELDPK
ncbi:MAG: CapA family protein [Anaerovoracaceae bacterium]